MINDGLCDFSFTKIMVFGRGAASTDIKCGIFREEKKENRAKIFLTKSDG